jgi:peptidoglycan/xylan/chitin deacetylase (PgdA/CDA1 family)
MITNMMISVPQPKYGLSTYINELKKEKQLWDLFTKKEEYHPKKMDKYGRIPYTTSGQNNALIPSVSKYLVQHGFHPEYIDGKKFAIFLSHDIDDIAISPRQMFRSIIPYPLHRAHLGSIRFLSTYVKKEKPYVNFRKIIELEKKYDASSSFFFLTTHEDVFGEKYHLEEIMNELPDILSHDCEIGLHTGFFCFDDLQKIKVEKERLEKVSGIKVVGVRNHLYRFKIPRTWDLLSQAGFAYDSSFGYHDIIGFRNGTCHPFKPYNLTDDKIIDIIEIPPCVVDITLFSYMNCDAKKAWTHIKNLIDIVEALGGVLTVLWHNWTFSYPVSYAGLFGKEWTKLYEKILKYGHEKHAWLTTGKNIADFVQKHYEKMSDTTF